MSTAPTIPVIDFKDWFTGDETARHRIGHSLAEACREFGFVQIINHGISSEIVAEALAIGETLFDLPMEDKMLAPHPPGYAVHRGYSKPGLEKVNHWVEGDPPPDTLYAGDVQEAKESYEVGSEENVDQPNVFLPNSVFPGFRDKTLKLYWEFHRASLEFIRALSVGIGLPPDGELALLAPHSGNGNQLRFLHYPPVQTRLVLEGRAARLPAHTDWGTITLLFQDSQGGLQVESPNQPGTFLDVEPIPGAVCMNICDALMRRTNDTLKSTLHRVVLPSNPSSFEINSDGDEVTKSRHSVVYFVAPDPDTTIECLPGCYDAVNVAKYKPMVFRDYCLMRAATMYK